MRIISDTIPGLQIQESNLIPCEEPAGNSRCSGFSDIMKDFSARLGRKEVGKDHAESQSARVSADGVPASNQEVAARGIESDSPGTAPAAVGRSAAKNPEPAGSSEKHEDDLLEGEGMASMQPSPVEDHGITLGPNLLMMPESLDTGSPSECNDGLADRANPTEGTTVLAPATPVSGFRGALNTMISSNAQILDKMGTTDPVHSDSGPSHLPGQQQDLPGIDSTTPAIAPPSQSSSSGWLIAPGTGSVSQRDGAKSFVQDVPPETLTNVPESRFLRILSFASSVEVPSDLNRRADATMLRTGTLDENALLGSSTATGGTQAAPSTSRTAIFLEQVTERPLVQSTDDPVKTTAEAGQVPPGTAGQANGLKPTMDVVAPAPSEGLTMAQSSAQQDSPIGAHVPALTETAGAVQEKSDVEVKTPTQGQLGMPPRSVEAEAGQATASRPENVDATGPSPQAGHGAEVTKTSSETELAKRVAPKDESPTQAEPISGHAAPAQSHATSNPRPIETKSSGAPEFLEQVADHIRLQIRNESGEIRVQLKPEFLGHLEIRAETGANGIVARIAASSENVKAFLETNLPVLQHSLQSQGLRVEKIEIIVHDGFGSTQTSAQQQSSGHNGGESPGEPSHSSGTASQASGVPGSDARTPDMAALPQLGPNSTFHAIA